LATRENAEDRVAQRSEHILGADQLGKLIEALVRKGYEVIGPRLRGSGGFEDSRRLVNRPEPRILPPRPVIRASAIQRKPGLVWCLIASRSDLYPESDSTRW